TEPEVSGGGEAVTVKWSAIHVQKRFTTQSVLKVGYDAVRNCYTYDIGSELEMLPGEPFQFRYGFDFEHHTPLDPFRWQYLLIRDGDGRISYRPLSPFDPGTLDNIQSYHGLRVWHGRTGDLHQVSPAVEYEIQPEWIQYQDDTGTVTTRRLNTAVCAAFYDTGVSFNAVTARPGDKIRVQYRYTGYPAEETNELFKTATVQNNPRIDPKQHFVFLRDQWPTIRFDDSLAMDKPWWGGRPMMSGHNARPAYDYVQEGGQGMLRLGPVSYAAAALGPEKLEPGPYLVSARVKSVNTHGPGGRLELLMLKKGDLNGNSFIRWDVGNIVSEQTRYFGRGSFDWRDVSFVAEVPKAATGLALGLGNSGTGEVFVSEVRIEPLGNRQSPPEMLSATPPSDDVVHDALWDLRMEEHKGLHIFNHGSSTYRTMELANLDWVTDEGHSAIRFSENPPERRDFPTLGILDQNLRNPAQRQNYEAVCHGAFALGGHHGGGEKLNGLTLAAWIKPAAEMGKSTSYSGKGDILGYGARRFILGLQGQAAPYSLVARINVNDTIDSSTKLDADRWYHVAMTCTPSDENWQVRLYLDGQEVGASVTKTLPASSTIPDSLVLGAELFYLHGAYYRGLMSRVLVVTRTMNGHEIRSLMNSRALRETKL
ncbi:MAG: LamG domain-containing protein, partial [Pirellula sp.]